jgi:hypothetical protein
MQMGARQRNLTSIKPKPIHSPGDRTTQPVETQQTSPSGPLCRVTLSVIVTMTEEQGSKGKVPT